MTSDLQSRFALVSLAIAIAVGLSVALVAWLVSRALAEVPREDREFKDAPPIGFRLAWWPVQWIGHYVEPLMTGRTRDALQTRLRQTGLDYSLTPAQFQASRVLCGAVMAMAAYWLIASFDTARSGPRPGPGLSAGLYLQAMVFGAVFGWAYPAIWLKDRYNARRRELLKALPFFLDIITLCVEAGLNLQGAMNQAVLKGPAGALRDEFRRVQRDIRAGKPRASALRDMAERLKEPAVLSFASAVIQAERMGMNLGPVLRAQADQRRTERFLRAEKLAMEAPVKMLFPLIAFIFPCTFIVLFFPIVMKFMHSGL